MMRSHLKVSGAVEFSGANNPSYTFSKKNHEKSSHGNDLCYNLVRNDQNVHLVNKG